jgi:hypothetical protein
MKNWNDLASWWLTSETGIGINGMASEVSSFSALINGVWEHLRAKWACIL